MKKVLWRFVAAVVSVALAQAARAADYPLVEARECRPRGGIANTLEKLSAGKEVRIAYFGGSITAQEGWRVKTLQWFQQQYPKAKVSEINAAIGGTGSDLGVYRLQHDVLDHKPDLVFIEFATNDGGADPKQIYRCEEGIARQIWKADPNIDICYVYTLTKAHADAMLEGKFPRAASAMEAVADRYNIPTIHMAMEVARLAKEGKLVWAGKLPKTDAEKAQLGDKVVFAGDGVHPYPETGHRLYLEAIVRSMEKLKQAGKAGPHAIPAPLAADNYERAKMLPLDRAKLSAGWQKLDATKDLGKRFAARVPQMFKADRPGESITFKFKGTAAGVYCLLGPDCGQVSVTIDSQPPTVKPLFDRYCVYHRLALMTVCSNLPDEVHTVKLEICPEQPNKDEIFKKGKQDAEVPSANPKKYKATAWYAGAITIVGELAE